MTDLEKTNDAELAAAELESLKAKADQLGVSYHPSISAAKLSAKIAASLKADEDEPAEAESTETPGQLAKRIQREALKLVRVNISCMNPQKADYDGEIFTIGNSVIPTLRKYVPYNTPDGYHIPQILFDALKAREYQAYYTERNANGQDIRRAKQVPEYNIVILPPLTKDELADLAKVQAAAGVIE